MIKGLLTLRLSRKSDAALQIICQKILLISKTCSESSSDFFAPFISEIALKRIVHRLSNIFLSQAICNSIALFWGDNSGMHTCNLSFFLHGQKFWKIKFTPKFAQEIANLHSKLPIFRVKSEKIYTGQKKITRAPPVTNIRYG